jgi:hypothetical protein
MRFTPIGPFSSWTGVAEGSRSGPEAGTPARKRWCGIREKTDGHIRSEGVRTLAAALLRRHRGPGVQPAQAAGAGQLQGRSRNDSRGAGGGVPEAAVPQAAPQVEVGVRTPGQFSQGPGRSTQQAAELLLAGREHSQEAAANLPRSRMVIRPRP